MITVRLADAADNSFLLHVLAVAADWRDGVDPRPVADVLASAELAHYAPDWASGDRGLIAEDDASGPVGAAWWRFFSADAPATGSLPPECPR